MRRHLAQNPMSHKKSDKRNYSLVAFGRDEATRTPDPYVPNVVRYQLRYIPNAIKAGAMSVQTECRESFLC